MSDYRDIENSEKFRREGNKMFTVEKYFAAIAQYNKSLILAGNNKNLASLCFANRSAVYLKLKYFKHCLHNIDMAEKHYPREKIQKLYERRDDCLRMMANCADKALHPFVHTFKLSYEPNPKLPFFIDAIQLKEDEIFGKHLITTRNLKSGDVIAVIDNPWRFALNDFTVNYLLGCYNCMKVNNGDMIRGECEALFCSTKCKLEHLQDSNHENFHEIEALSKNVREGDPEVLCTIMTVAKMFLRFHDAFGNIDEMREFVEAHSDKRYDVFDFDWNIDVNDPVYFKNIGQMLLTIMGVRVDEKVRKEFDVAPIHLQIYRDKISPGNRLLHQTKIPEFVSLSKMFLLKSLYQL